jgi:hypothetical protein
MVDAIQSHNADYNKVDSDDVVQQPWRNENQYPRDERNDGRNMRNSEMHHNLLQRLSESLGGRPWEHASGKELCKTPGNALDSNCTHSKTKSAPHNGALTPTYSTTNDTPAVSLCGQLPRAWPVEYRQTRGHNTSSMFGVRLRNILALSLVHS